MWRRIGLLLLCVSSLLLLPVSSHTDSDDVSALNGMYGTLNSDSQLNSWTSNNGDPCGQSWRGVSCSGSAVTEIRLSGLGLNGYLEGYMLEKMKSLKFLDLSNNNIGANKELPYAYPPKLKHLDLSGNGYTGSPPWAINKMLDIEYLNIKKNKLSGGLGDMFQNLNHLSMIDLSGNSFSGELPQSFSKLSKLKTLYLQNNKFTGTINVLSNLPLENLNIANNKFSGWIPSHLKHIKNLQLSFYRQHSFIKVLICVKSQPQEPTKHQSISNVSETKIRDGLDLMSSEEKMKLELQKIRDEFKISESDCGSSRVQVAQLTVKIKHLSSVLHKKDKHSLRGLQAMVQRRRKLLKYLRRTDWDSYCFVISKLKLSSKRKRMSVIIQWFGIRSTRLAPTYFLTEHSSEKVTE